MSDTDTILGCHHVALRCNDASETMQFYTQILGMKFVIATRENQYRGAPIDYLHIFLQMEDGNYLSFFEVPSLKPKIPDPNTPEWVQHYAYRAPSRSAVEGIKAELERRGVAVEGPIFRPPFYSIYFQDPNGYRIEVTALDARNEGRYRPTAEGAAQVLQDWCAEKRGGVAA